MLGTVGRTLTLREQEIWLGNQGSYKEIEILSTQSCDMTIQLLGVWREKVGRGTTERMVHGTVQANVRYRSVMTSTEMERKHLETFIAIC